MKKTENLNGADLKLIAGGGGWYDVTNPVPGDNGWVVVQERIGENGIPQVRVVDAGIIYH